MKKIDAIKLMALLDTMHVEEVENKFGDRIGYNVLDNNGEKLHNQYITENEVNDFFNRFTTPVLTEGHATYG